MNPGTSTAISSAKEACSTVWVPGHARDDELEG
jgi:hypothetical protein